MKKEYIGQLTGIRIFLTLMVVLSNMVLFYDIDPGFVRNLDWTLLNALSVVPFRVDIFFMLTGFLLFYIYEKEFSEKITLKSYRKFFLIRLARIYPVHFLALLMIFILHLCGIWGSIDSLTIHRIEADGNWLLNLMLLNGWGFGERNSSWNGPSWSISIEFFNYILFPVIALIIFNIKKFWLQISVFFGILLFYEYLQYSVIQNMSTYKGSTAMLRGFAGMTIGIILAQIYLSKRLEKLPWDIIATALICLIGLMMYTFSDQDRITDHLLYLILPFLVIAIASSKTFIKRFFSTRILIYFGNLSFCVYMLHQPVTRLFRFYLSDYYDELVLSGNDLIISLNLVAVIATIIILSAFVYRYIEVPFRTHVKKSFSKE